MQIIKLGMTKNLKCVDPTVKNRALVSLMCGHFGEVSAMTTKKGLLFVKPTYICLSCGSFHLHCLDA